MLPVPLTITVNELLDRCASNYHSLTKEKSSGENNFRAKKIFVNDEYEIDIIIHLAAQAGVRCSIENPQAYINSNINGFFNILETCISNQNQ